MGSCPAGNGGVGILQKLIMVWPLIVLCLMAAYGLLNFIVVLYSNNWKSVRMSKLSQINSARLPGMFIRVPIIILCIVMVWIGEFGNWLAEITGRYTPGLEKYYPYWDNK